MKRAEQLSARQAGVLLALYEAEAYGDGTATIYALTDACSSNSRPGRKVTHLLAGGGAGYGATFASLRRRGYVSSRFVIEARCEWWQLTEKGEEAARLIVARTGGPMAVSGPRLRPSALAERLVDRLQLPLAAACA